MQLVRIAWLGLLFSGLFITACDPSGHSDPVTEDSLTFYFGADLSYANQILDHNGTYRDSSEIRSPYRILSDHGANLARFRLWHTPNWTKEVYGTSDAQSYSDLEDVKRSIAAAKDQEMQVLLDFHYSDTWADPENQIVPAAWADITSMDILEDSVYAYTYKTLSELVSLDLAPDLVQLGNETNCGFFFTNQPVSFPDCNVCDGYWGNAGRIINAGIRAIREVLPDARIVLHVADPINVEWWFTNIESQASVTDYDVVGFSYYPLWHTDLGITNLSSAIAGYKEAFGKEVMLLEIGYPWTDQWNDDYTNSMGSETPLSGFPYSPEGQLALLRYVTQRVMDGGGLGVIYWEPDWITSDMRDQWGTGSAWENCAFFDFDGNALTGITFMNTDTYDFE